MWISVVPHELHQAPAWLHRTWASLLLSPISLKVCRDINLKYVAVVRWQQTNACQRFPISRAAVGAPLFRRFSGSHYDVSSCAFARNELGKLCLHLASARYNLFRLFADLEPIEFPKLNESKVTLLVAYVIQLHKPCDATMHPANTFCCSDSL